MKTLTFRKYAILHLSKKSNSKLKAKEKDLKIHTHSMQMNNLGIHSLISNKKVHHNFMCPYPSLTGKNLAISLTQELSDSLKINFFRKIFLNPIFNLNFTLILEILPMIKEKPKLFRMKIHYYLKINRKKVYHQINIQIMKFKIVKKNKMN